MVEDEVALNHVILEELIAAGYEVRQAFDGATALQMVEERLPNLVILDWMLPGVDGLAVCRQLRREHLMPIIMLTARSEEVDRVMGLEVGADDYLVKPFAMRELPARTRAILRRFDFDTQLPAERSAETDQRPIVNGPLRIETWRRRVLLDGAEVDLTPKEWDLLVLFACNPGRAFNREFLIERIWGGDYEVFDRAVDNHMRRLRQKLGAFGDRIETVRGVGYRFVD